MKVNEIFESFQGEGRYMGMPCIFVRLQGCNLTCGMCDTKYTWKKSGGMEMSVQEVLDKTDHFDHIVFTGGDPCLQMKELIKFIKKTDTFVEIETNGTIFDERLTELTNVHVNVSPKPEFFDKKYIRALEQWNEHCDYKFVIHQPHEGGEEDIEVVNDLVTNVLNLKNVTLMPEGIESFTILRGTKWLIEELKRRRWNHMKVTTRLHVILYGNQRGI